jgi:hypothetical protein
MIKLALFDLGETLIHGNEPFPHVVPALNAISRFHNADGGPLVIGLVSDFTMPEPPVTEAKITAAEEEYCAILATAGLEEFFEPFEERVTLSSRARVRKPDRRIFELAAQRSGTGAELDECLYVTESVEQLKKCQEYGMTPVRFGQGARPGRSFDDWADAPGLIADLVAPDDNENRQAAAAAVLSARHDLQGFTPHGESGGRKLTGDARRLVQLNNPRLGALNGIFVELPAQVDVELNADGRVAKVAATPPGDDDVADAVNYVSNLVKSGKVAAPGEQVFGATHAVVEDAAGRRRLVRRGYSAH